jgi:hypothetical protein
MFIHSLCVLLQERQPPLADDFLYICDDAYTRDQLMAMERDMLKLLQFDIGYPLTYKYVRRYAKVSEIEMFWFDLFVVGGGMFIFMILCFIILLFLSLYLQATKASMELLTLARYITEMALMYFEFSQLSESLVAASAFALASRMIEGDKVDDGFWVLFIYIV